MRLDGFSGDLRYGARTLIRNPGYALVAVFALALGVGVNTATFTAYKAMVARPLDARDPNGMVNLALVRQSGATDWRFSYPEYEQYRDSIPSFSGVIAESHKLLSLSDEARSGGEQPVMTFMVSDNYFSVLGVNAVRGRTFDVMTIEELWANPPVLISEKWWKERFGGDPSILGRTIRLNRAAFSIAGITPGDFTGTFVSAPDVWIPLRVATLVHADDDWLRNPDNECCRLFARLAPGATTAQAEAQMTRVAEEYRSRADRSSPHAEPAVGSVWLGSPFPTKIEGGLLLAVALVMVASALVLVVACANVASLQLARSTARRHELSIRVSLGASRKRLVAQLLTESVLTAFIAGALALFLTWILLKAAVTAAANAFPSEYGTLIFYVDPDLAIFTYVFLMSMIAGVLSGLAPALESSGSSVKAHKGATVRTRWLQMGLVAGQVAVSTVLLIAGGLFIRSAIRSLQMTTGYETSRVVNLQVRFPEWKRYTREHKGAVVDEIRTRVAALPGVEEVTSARAPLANTIPRRATVSLDEFGSSGTNKIPVVFYTHVEENYFRVLSIAPVASEDFPALGEHSVAVSESAARQLWPGINPVGRVLRLSTEGHFRPKDEPLPDGRAYEVSGVVRDTRGFQLDRSDAMQVYLRMPEGHRQEYPMLIRIQSDPREFLKSVEPTVRFVDPDVAVASHTLDDLLRQTPAFVISSFGAAGASSIGLLGLLLACMGLYGTVNFLVALRTREVGIRMAIGAQRRDILGLILRESLRPVALGLMVGVVLAAGVCYLLRSLFYGMEGLDGVPFLSVVVFLTLNAIAAAYAPCRRAMRVDPMTALRHE